MLIYGKCSRDWIERGRAICIVVPSPFLVTSTRSEHFFASIVHGAPFYRASMPRTERWTSATDLPDRGGESSESNPRHFDLPKMALQAHRGLSRLCRHVSFLHVSATEFIARSNSVNCFVHN